MTLIDHGDGSADFEGYPYDLNGTDTTCPTVANGGCSIWVTNQSTPAYNYSDAAYAHSGPQFLQQPFGPSATLKTTDLNLVNGNGRSVAVTATGGSANLPVQFLTPCGLPAEIHLTDAGTGLAKLWSTKPAHTTGQVSFVIYPYSPGAAHPPSNVCANPNVTAHFVDQLVVLNSNNAVFTAGAGGVSPC